MGSFSRLGTKSENQKDLEELEKIAVRAGEISEEEAKEIVEQAVTKTKPIRSEEIKKERIQENFSQGKGGFRRAT